MALRRGSSCLFNIKRLLVTRSFIPSITTRSFKTCPTMSQEQMDDLAKNPYFSKYADKISKLQKTSPEEFLERLAQTQKKQESANKPAVEEKKFSFPSTPKASLESEVGSVKEKKLDSIMKLELLQDKSKEEIAEIWREYHKNKDSVVAVIPQEVYSEMKKRFQEFGTFLFPLPRKEGYEFVVVQFSGNEAHFTTLINYHAYKENSPECLTMIHYTDLAQEKGIVLMVGEYDTKILTIHEAQCLANQVEMYYYKPSPQKAKLMHTFLNAPLEFKHSDLIKEMENIHLELPTVKSKTAS